jgi:hypothetical protein
VGWAQTFWYWWTHPIETANDMWVRNPPLGGGREESEAAHNLFIWVALTARVLAFPVAVIVGPVIVVRHRRRDRPPPSPDRT